MGGVAFLCWGAYAVMGTLSGPNKGVETQGHARVLSEDSEALSEPEDTARILPELRSEEKGEEKSAGSERPPCDDDKPCLASEHGLAQVRTLHQASTSRTFPD